MQRALREKENKSPQASFQSYPLILTSLTLNIHLENIYYTEYSRNTLWESLNHRMLAEESHNSSLKDW